MFLHALGVTNYGNSNDIMSVHDIQVGLQPGSTPIAMVNLADWVILERFLPVLGGKHLSLLSKKNRDYAKQLNVCPEAQLAAVQRSCTDIPLNEAQDVPEEGPR